MQVFGFQLLRYVPDPVKDEFINIGVVLRGGGGAALGARMASEDDLRRVRCLHPAADLELLRSLQAEVEADVAARPEAAAARLAAMLETGSHCLRLEHERGCEAEDRASALESVYRAFVASPPRPAAAARRGTGLWVKREADSVFRAEGLLERLDAGIWAQRFTYPGDPFRIHYAYRNGSAHYIHMLSLRHSVQQAKVVAFTFERVRAAARDEAEPRFTAVVEDSPPDLPTVRFTRQLLEESRIQVMPLDRIQGLVRQVKEELRVQ